MRDTLLAHRTGTRGLDVGCGQGWYVERMRAFGFDVTGIDESAGQIALAARNLGSSDLVSMGSTLAIPAADGTYDFAYVINVLHHLSSVEEQRAAFAEIVRVLRPGGLLFVHEINTRNIVFRFYMGYVFPSLNCIDEGIERWILPHQLRSYTDVPVIETRYFTFLPEFIPGGLVRLLAPLERLLERSPLGVYAAHYLAVLRKPA
jgi:SAM-dependent methyltransferase